MKREIKRCREEQFHRQVTQNRINYKNACLPPTLKFSRPVISCKAVNINQKRNKNHIIYSPLTESFFSMKCWKKNQLPHMGAYLLMDFEKGGKFKHLKRYGHPKIKFICVKKKKFKKKLDLFYQMTRWFLWSN